MAGQPSSTVFHFSWEEIYMAALMETDSTRLPELIKVAAGTLLDRLLVLTASRGNESEVGSGRRCAWQLGGPQARERFRI